MIKINSTTVTTMKALPYFDKTNKKVIGKFKDEAAGVPICEFVGLRSKMYSYMKDDQKGEKTAKGIKKNVIKMILSMKTISKHYSMKNKCTTK